MFKQKSKGNFKMKISKNDLYKRQVILKEFGEEGQQKLQQSTIVIVGCGGLGSVAAVYLAGSGVGNIHLIDFDIVDVSNLHRQVFYTTDDIGKSKAKVLANHMRSISPFVQVTTSDQAITKANIFDQIDDYDVVVDCTDSLPTKYLLNDYCVITDHILVYGSLYKNDGYIASFNIPEGLYNSANLRHAFPKMPKETVPKCSEIGTLNPIVGIIGLMQANEVIKILSQTGEPLKNQLLIYNSADNSQFKMRFEVEKNCDNIGKRGILKIFKNEEYLDPTCDPNNFQNENLLISMKDFKQKLDDKSAIIISVIEDEPLNLLFDISTEIPISSFDVDTLEMDTNKEYHIICRKGLLSYTVAELLKDEYPELKVFSLKNGIENY